VVSCVSEGGVGSRERDWGEMARARHMIRGLKVIEASVYKASKH